jgi:hypothetical protein
MNPEWVTAVMEYLFGTGTDPRPSGGIYYLKLRDAAGDEISTSAWTDYAPQPVDADADEFGTGATAGSGNRIEMTTAVLVEFSDAAVVPGTSPVVRYTSLHNAATGGLEVGRYELPQDRAIVHGAPVRVPVGQGILAMLHGA